MPLKKQILQIRILFFLCLLLLGACNKQKEETIIYKKPLKLNFDATCTWLNDVENYNKKNYLSVFYTYYDKKIKEEKFIDASRAMEIVSFKKSSHVLFDKPFMDAISFYSKNYRNKVPAINASFVESYLGDYYSDKGEFTKAISYYTKNTLIPVNDYKSCYKKGDAYSTISWCYQCIGDQKSALAANYKALDYFKQTDQTNILQTLYDNFGGIYEAMHDYDNALKYNSLAIKYTRGEKYSNVYTYLFNRINIYDHAGQYDKMYALSDSTYQAFKKSGEVNTWIKVPLSQYYITKLYHEGKFDEAKVILDQLKPEVMALNSNITNLEYDVLVADYEIKKNKGIKDTKLIKKSIPILIENRHFKKLHDCYAVLLEDAVAKRDYKNAHLYAIEGAKIQDSIASMEMANAVIEFDVKYKTEKKEQQIAIQENTIQNKNTTIALLISVLIGFGLIGAALILLQKQRKLKREKQNTQLYTKQLLEKTEEERKRIASDLHDSVSHELLSLKNTFEENAESTNKKIDGIINDIRSISRNLHPIMFDKVGLKATINQMVERTQNVNDFMVTAEIDYKGSLSSAVELQIYRIIQEALSNSIKYADAVAARISVIENKSNVIIEIKDNGKGFNVQETLNNNHSFGLHNIIERSRAIGGEAKIVSDPNGTIITIEIKKFL